MVLWLSLPKETNKEANMEKCSGIKEATIAASGTTSSSVECQGFHYAALMVPDLTTSTELTVQVSHDDTNWEELRDEYLGTAGDRSVPKQKGSIVQISGWAYFRLVAADAQAAERITYVRLI